MRRNRRKLFSELLDDDVMVVEASEQTPPEAIIEDFVEDVAPDEVVLQTKLRDKLNKRLRSRFFDDSVSNTEDMVSISIDEDKLDKEDLTDLVEKVVEKVDTELFTKVKSRLIKNYKRKFIK